MFEYHFKKKSFNREVEFFRACWKHGKTPMPEDEFKRLIAIYFGASPSTLREKLSSYIKLGFINHEESKGYVKINWGQLDKFFKEVKEHDDRVFL